MKFTIERITEGENEVILKYLDMTPEVERIYQFLNGEQQKIIGWLEQEKIILDINQILYIESVDSKTFAYTKNHVVRIDYPLYRMQQLLSDINFFRCSKSMIINIDYVEKLRSLSSNRIDATMRNGEHILISRTYASDFRRRLKGGASDA